eukprot:TRINITY_DN67212_c1_g1_i1.p2 TRINITY_DN67212_c1_g1~~TRINITY_DN67212_c1_g1_i1.p2  ORF type:complete len:138 (+),score=28.66 TRINITY_DN67212_c1_g1_i1:95-508(+)
MKVLQAGVMTAGVAVAVAATVVSFGAALPADVAIGVRLGVGAGGGVVGLTAGGGKAIHHLRKKFRKAGGKEIKAGETFIVSGTLSLVKTVECLEDDGSISKFTCWTGPTHNSNRDYQLSKLLSTKEEAKELLREWPN